MDVPQVHAATGVLCLGDPSTTSASAPCPAASPVFDGPSGQQIRIGVFISGSDGLFLSDITLLANHTLLRPVGIDLTNSVLIGTPKLEAECLLGIQVIGVCSPTDSVDTLHLVVHSASGSSDTASPTNGLLFTAIYNITGLNPAGKPVSMGFQTGCSNTSVSPDVCVTIQNGTGVTLSETVQTGAVFDNSASATMPFVVVSANATSFGPEFPNVSNHANLTATAKNGYPGSASDSVSFTAQASSGLSATFSIPNPCSTLGAGCSVTLTLSAAGAGNYTAIVYGTYSTVDASGSHDTLSSGVSLRVQVTDFTFSVSPITISFISGEIGTATATLSSVNGFSGDVKLSTVLASSGLSISYDPNTMTLTAGGTGTSTIIFKASPPSATTYLAQIKATSGTLSKKTPLLTIKVAAPVPDFYFVATPSSIGPIGEGEGGTSTVTVTYVNGFTGTVTLTNSTSSPSLSTHLNQTSLTATHNVTLTVSAPEAAGYSLNVTGTSGTTVHIITIRVIVVDFNLTATPDVLGIGQGTSGVSDIHVTAVNGFGISLTANASPGLVVALSPGSITGSGDSILNVTAPSAMSPGLYNVNVTGLSVSLQHVVQVNVTVLKNDFSIIAVPNLVSAKPNANATSTITVSSLNGFIGAVALSVAAPSGVKASLNPPSVTLPRGGGGVSVLTLNASLTGSYLVNVTGIGGSGGSLTHTVGLNFTVSLKDFMISASPLALALEVGVSGRPTIVVTAIGGFSDNVTLSDSAQTGLMASLSSTKINFGSGSAFLTVSATMAGNYTVTVTGMSGSLSHTTAVINVQVVDFTIGASPNPVQTAVGQRGNSTVTITALNHFSGVVTLTSDSTSCILTQTSVTGSGSSTLSCKFSVLTSYNILVTASDKPSGGSLSYSKIVTIRVGDFGISQNALTLTIEEGSSATFQATVSSENGFAGSVSLSYYIVKPSGSFSGGVPTVVFSQSPVTLASGGSQTVDVTVKVGTDVLSYPFGIGLNATSSGLVRTVGPISLTVPVPTFSILSSPVSVTTGPGVLSSSTVTLTSTGGLHGQVNLTLDIPSGVQCSLSLSSVRLHVDGSNSTVLSCGGSIGSYTVGISGAGVQPNGASITKSDSVGVVVADFSLSSTPTGILVNTTQPGHASISISWTGHYNGTVNLSLTASSGLTASLNSTSLTGAGTSGLTVVANDAGTYSLIVHGTSGSASHNVTLTVTVLSTTPSGTSNIFGLDPTVFYSGVGVLIAAIAAGVFLMSRRRKSSR